jgi:hypothetical protein
MNGAVRTCFNQNLDWPRVQADVREWCMLDSLRQKRTEEAIDRRALSQQAERPAGLD